MWKRKGDVSLMEKKEKCLNCKKYETPWCPPWPVKGPNHWCTQYDPREVD